MGTQLREFAGWARNRKFAISVLFMLTLAIGILIGTVISGHVSATRGPLANGATPIDLPNPISMSNAFSAIVKRDAPAVVNISTTQMIERSGGAPRQRGRDQDSFQDFFNRFFDDAPQEAPEAARSLGSGMIVDKRGFILTNNHVVDQATKIQVQLNKENTLYTAHVVGIDLETDLAVIKIDTDRDLPTVKLGNSDGVQVGDWVLAIGSPFGLQASVTAGIISATDRGDLTTVGSTGRPAQFQHFLQTDAAINPGNSGGPLVDMAGNVIGVNTAIMTGGRGYEGVGFALPSSMVIGVYNQIIERGKVTRGSIGVTFKEDESSNPIVLRDLGANYGMVLELVQPGSPAAKAGLKSGDVVTAINGHPVKSGNDLVDPIAETPVGSDVRLSYLRNHQSYEATVTVEDRNQVFPEQRVANAAPGAAREGSRAIPTTAALGMNVVPLAGGLARALPNMRGVVVSEVAPASFSEDIGFLRGDLIQQINHVPINSMIDYTKAIAGLRPGKQVVFQVARRAENKTTLTVFLAGIVPTAGE